MGRLRSGESGYSLVEVMVSIIILSIAIIPMVSMFDVGLKAATRGGSYDQARALANERLEEIKALPFKNDTPQNDSVVETYPPGKKTLPGGRGFDSVVTTAYQDVNSAGEYRDSGKDDINPANDGKVRTTRMKVTVDVTWNGNSFTATGLVASGTR
ncbi:prepilin-type N-terminal cleavage/methylation domain-containing protein [Rubrobacter marinus]|uniref:Prepilin-type N-terminal cleavage/methylation domain-containing protein n=1 Tax=Rubrobacter marinus TaxID=2653852 RepID=A0A6G8PUZ5_9ACTN|nr:prepilin-type N-terminal cleavage/methylation domain-containing protein [Rubrobacter marinus]QIN78019.1 prepilin-type N-terminal cleavage/methylation domain-containing protein [Rubrobacter marinus]